MLLFLLAIAAVFFIEQRIKTYIRSAPPENIARSFWNDRVRIQHVENTGFSASRLKDRPEVVQAVSAITAFVSFLTVLPQLFRHRKDAGFLLGAGLLFGGSLANLFDHTFRGSVPDYLRFPKLPWKKVQSLVFNFADLCIVLGAVIVMLHALFGKKDSAYGS